MYYLLTHPNYDSDFEFDKENPIEIINPSWIPGLICPSCGTWASNKRTYRKILDIRVEKIINKDPMDLKNWEKMENLAGQFLEISPQERLFPGEVVGDPIGNITDAITNDFIFTWTGEVIVNASVVSKFLIANISGVSFKKLKIENPSSQLFEALYILIAQNIEADRKLKIELCNNCGRHLNAEKFDPIKKDLYSGNLDVFSLNDNPNIIYASEKCYEFIKDNNFSNVELKNYG